MYASLVVVYKLVKHNNPFSDGEFVKECMDAPVKIVSGNAAQECFFVQENYSAPC